MAIQTGRGRESAALMKCATCSVRISYKVHDPALDSALRSFAELYGAKKGGSGFDLETQKRDISFVFENAVIAGTFLDHVKERFRVQAKIAIGRNL